MNQNGSLGANEHRCRTEIDGKTVYYIVRRSARVKNTMNIRSGSGYIVVTAGTSAKEDEIEKFLQSKREWLLKTLYFEQKDVTGQDAEAADSTSGMQDGVLTAETFPVFVNGALHRSYNAVLPLLTEEEAASFPELPKIKYRLMKKSYCTYNAATNSVCLAYSAQGLPKSCINYLLSAVVTSAAAPEGSAR